MVLEPLKILVVEDEDSHVEAIKRAFSRAQFPSNIEIASSLNLFHQQVPRERPDIVLIDLNLSDGSALDVLNQPVGEISFPILIMTAHGNEELAVAAMKAGALDYVVKSPESFLAMPQIVQRAMREWRLIQEKKGAEEALIASEQQLRAALGVAEQASRAKSEFLANMSHEIRTPLNGMFGMLQYLKTTPLLDEQLECLDLALESGQKLLKILNDILDLSRIEAGRLDLHRGLFDPGKLVRQVRDIFLPNAAAKNLILQADLSHDFPEKVIGDEGRLRQVLFNLVGNAVKFTDAGHIIISGQVERVLERPGKLRLGFSVTDSGIGIPHDKLAIIFEPFMQADGSSTRKYGGTGLGLSIVKRLVALMNGSLSIESEPGKGTTIGFHVEVDETAVSQARGASDTGKSSSDKISALKILLAEDDRVNRLTLGRLLEKDGHQVRHVADGHSCVEVLRSEPFDLILMDVQMPVMDGLEATKQIRALADSTKAETLIIALTAHAMKGDREKGDREKFLDAGMNGYISKPVRLDELRAMFARYF